MNDKKKWLKEFDAFLQTEDSGVPPAMTAKVVTLLKELLNPSAWSVFIKILSVHLAVGFASLSVCHQFGMNPFGTENSLDNWFMGMWGHSTCMIACGTLFLALSVLAAGAFLSVEEFRALKRTEFLQAFSLGGISLALFAIFGAELAVTFAGLWLLGALIGGFIATEAISKLKELRA